MENRLRDIAQTIKRKPNVPDGDARRTKQPTFTTVFRDSGNDEADESGYYTATAGNADEAGTKVNRSWYAPKKMDQFMQPAGGETVYDKSERRALELRSKRKQQLLQQSRSRVRANAEVASGQAEEVAATAQTDNNT